MKWQRPLATFVLALVIPAVGIWFWNHPSLETREAIENNYIAWHSALAEQRMSDAYAIMSPIYRKSHSINDFSEDFAGFAESHTRLQPNCELRGFGSYAWLYPLKAHDYELRTGPDYEWVKINGTWYMTGEYHWYLD